MGTLRRHARRLQRRLRRARRKMVGADLARTTLLTAPAGAVVPAAPAVPAPVPRLDPVPDFQPLPQARYVFMVGAVPRRFGGRTASVLTKTRLFQQLGGVGSTIVTLNFTVALEETTAELRQRGLLVDGVQIVNLYDDLRGGDDPSAEVVRHEVDEPGMEKIRDRSREVYRFFENGVYRLFKHYDSAGRLLVRDWFNENRARTRRDEFGMDGRLRRTTYMDLHHNLPRQQVFFRADGSAYLNKWLAVDPETRASVVERVTLFDQQGRPTQVLADDVALVQHYLEKLLGNDRAFLSVESRLSDPEVETFDPPNVKQIAVLHNPHLRPPADDVSLIRPSYQSVFDRRDRLASIVFLTIAQRADAEAHFGRHESFRVIPHPATAAPQVPFDQRDPNLVVMLARLDEQKQLDHAIDAFALVVERVPAARLEIYGEGQDRPALQSQIDRLGLGESVILAGYTKNPGAVYQRASLSLLTSRFEGYGLVLLETLAHGCPVVSYAVKYGPSEIVSDGVNGYLVEPGDRAALAQRVVEVLTDPLLRRRLSDQASAPRLVFSEHTFVARWSKLFHDLDAQGWD